MNEQASGSTRRRSIPEAVLCPYCGHISRAVERCETCRGHFDPLSRQATQNKMGPWLVRDMKRPFHPGFSYETLRDLIEQKKVTRNTVLRGPTTRQFWTTAGRTPSVANLLGVCHNCAGEVSPSDYMCGSCGAVFTPEVDRQHLGLAPVNLLPGEAPPERIAASTVPPGPAPTGHAASRDRSVSIGGEARRVRTWLTVAAVAVVSMGFGVVIGRMLAPAPAAIGPVEPDPVAASGADLPANPMSEEPQPAPVAMDSSEMGASPQDPRAALVVVRELALTGTEGLREALAMLSDLERDAEESSPELADLKAVRSALERWGHLAELRGLP